MLIWFAPQQLTRSCNFFIARVSHFEQKNSATTSSEEKFYYFPSNVKNWRTDSHTNDLIAEDKMINGLLFTRTWPLLEDNKVFWQKATKIDENLTLKRIPGNGMQYGKKLYCFL